MTVYAYSKVAVYSELSGTLRLARNTRVLVTDVVTGAPVNVTHGSVVASYFDTDSTGVASFTAEHPGPLRLTCGATFVDVFSDELPGIALDAVAAAEAAQAAAEDAAAAAYGPTDATVSSLVGSASSTRTALDGRYVQGTATQPINRGGTGATTAAAALVALGGAPLSLTGTYAARPAANTVGAGTIYHATDVPEQYRSNGTAWSVVGSGGAEIGHTQIIADGAAQGPAQADVPGITVTFVAGERPIEIAAEVMFSVASSAVTVAMIVMLDGAGVGNDYVFTGTTSLFVTLKRRVRVSGLTPGTSHTAKVQVVSTSGTVTPKGVAANPSWIRVKTL